MRCRGMGDALAQSLDHKAGAAFDVRRSLITSAYGAFFVGRCMQECVQEG